MKISKIVTLFVILVLLASVSIVSANGDDDESRGDLCHVPRGNPSNAHVIPANDSSWERHFANHGGDFIITDDRPCPPNGDDDGGEDGEDGDDDNGDNPGGENPGDIVNVEEAPAPALLQITVWPDTFQVANLTGFTWTIDGNPIYTDSNANGVYDLGEEIVTQVEYRDRPVCGEPGPVVLNQPFSRLVLNMTMEDVEGDLQAFLARFEAEINGVDVDFGWYDVTGEFAPCLGAEFDGAVQLRQDGVIVIQAP